MPACINEWKQGVCNKTMGKTCKNCQYRENKPLTLDVIKMYKSVHFYFSFKVHSYIIININPKVPLLSLLLQEDF